MNFRKRIITTFLLFAIALTVVFGLLMDNLMVFVEDQIVRDFLSENMDYFEEKIQNEVSEDILITTSKVKGYLTHFNGVPEEFNSLSDGFHDTKDSHVLVKTLDTGFYTGEKLILLFDESKSFLDINENAIVLAIIIFSLVIVALAAVVCIYLAKSIASPIEYLAKKVSAEQGSISDSSVLSRRDELGSLARAFSLSVEQIHNLLEREKNFTRYASHELRTPLTVVKNNIDILRVVTKRLPKERSEPDDKVTKTFDNSIKRLNQAVWFMEQQVNTLLLLARGEYQPKLDEVELLPLINDVEAYFPDLILSKKFSEGHLVTTDPTVLLSILINILNNVIEHGADDNGKTAATIEANQTGFSVSNTTSTAPKSGDGKRFGLEIVEQLCDVMSWNLAIEENENQNNNQFSVVVSYIK